MASTKESFPAAGFFESEYGDEHYCEKLKPFYEEPLFEEESNIEILREKNPGLVIENIHFSDLNGISPIHNMSILIHLWITFLLESKKYNVTKLKHLNQFLNDTIELSNLMYFKIITRMESRKIRVPTMKVISTSLSERNIFDEDEDNDINDSEEGISSVFEIDDQFIHDKTMNIVEKNYNFPRIEAPDFFGEINFKNTMPSSHVLKSFEFLIDRDFSHVKKKLLLLIAIFRNNDSDNSKLNDLLLHVGNLDCTYAEKRLHDLKSIPKSIWHLYHSMDISFLISMLIWVENSVDKNPHDVFVMAEPLFQYLSDCLDENNPKMIYVSEKITPDIHYIENDTPLQRNRKNMKQNLDKLIRIIDGCRKVKDCQSCRVRISAIINNQEIPSSPSSCLITNNLKKLRQSIHNLNKHTKKLFNHGESQKATAVSPVLKQILSLIGTISNINNNKLKARNAESLSCSSSQTVSKRVIKMSPESVHETTMKIIDIQDFNIKFQNQQDLLSEISNDVINNLTVLPLNFTELFGQENYKSFLLTFKNRINESITISIHKIYVETERTDLFFIIDTFTKENTDKCSAGILIVSDDIKKIIHYLENSIYSDKKLKSSVQMIRFSREEMKIIKKYLKENLIEHSE